MLLKMRAPTLEPTPLSRPIANCFAMVSERPRVPWVRTERSAASFALARRLSLSLAKNRAIAIAEYDVFSHNAFKDVRAQNFPHTDFVKTLTAGRE